MCRMYETLYQNKIRIHPILSLQSIYEIETQNNVILLMANGIFRKNNVYYFKEKSSVDEGWINGGFFVFEPEISKYLKNDSTYLERDPFEKLAKKKKIKAFKYNGFWQCMDTKRDKDFLEKNLKKYK